MGRAGYRFSKTTWHLLVHGTVNSAASGSFNTRVIARLDGGLNRVGTGAGVSHSRPLAAS